MCNGTVGPYIDPRAPVQIVTGSGVSFFLFFSEGLRSDQHVDIYFGIDWCWSAVELILKQLALEKMIGLLQEINYFEYLKNDIIDYRATAKVKADSTNSLTSTRHSGVMTMDTLE